MFRILLISDDPSLYRLCREAVEGLDVAEHELNLASTQDEPGPAALYLWDFQPERRLPEALCENLSRSLILVGKDALAALRGKLSNRAASVLLKPVAPRKLRLAIDQFTAQESRACPPAVAFGGQGMDDLLESLLRANRKLQEYEDFRINFLARALHDFRAPLTALNGYCGLLIEQQFGALNTRQAEHLTRMQRSISRIVRLATAMFDLGAGSAFPHENNFREGRIEECIERAVQEITPLADERQITISVEIVPPARKLQIEPERIEQVLVNLIENACRFAPKRSVVQVFGRPFFSNLPSAAPPSPACAGAAPGKPSQGFRVDVRDSGCGIPKERLGHLFEEHAPYAGPRDRSGAGLGLAICRLIVCAHHGAIWAESGASGVCFSFTLPYDRPNAGGQSRNRSGLPDSLM